MLITFFILIMQKVKQHSSLTCNIVSTVKYIFLTTLNYIVSNKHLKYFSYKYLSFKKRKQL